MYFRMLPFSFRDETVDYQARQHEIDFTFSPYTSSSKLSFSDAQKTLQMKYRKTVFLTERSGKKTSGLDPAYIRSAEKDYKDYPLRDPAMPVVSKSDQRLVLDVEGLVANKDGRWVSYTCFSLYCDYRLMKLFI